MRFKIKTVILLFILSFSVLAQKDTIYTLTADAGIGYSRYLSTLSYPDLKKQGFSGSVKIIWHPEHLLSIGLETGYHYLYYIKSDQIEVSMIAVPLLFVASMRIFPITLPNLELQGGGGAYFMYNSGTLLGTDVYSSLYSFGYHLGATYLQKVSDKIKLGGEFKYYYISKLQDSSIILRFVVSYKFFQW